MCDICPVNRYYELSDTTKDIILPYYREIISTLPSSAPRSIYTDCHLFCLKKNLMTLIHQFDPKYDIGLSTREISNQMRVVIRIYQGGIHIMPDKDLYDIVNKYLLNYIDIYPHCIVYQKDRETKYNKKWLEDILPHLNIGIYGTDGNIFINLDGIANFNQYWQKTYDEITSKLEKYYNMGVICKPNEELIKRWNLKSIDGVMYRPVWEYNFTHDKVGFLMKEKKMLLLYLGINNRIKTKEGWFIQEVKSYAHVDKIMNDIF